MPTPAEPQNTVTGPGLDKPRTVIRLTPASLDHEGRMSEWERLGLPGPVLKVDGEYEKTIIYVRSTLQSIRNGNDRFNVMAEGSQHLSYQMAAMLAKQKAPDPARFGEIEEFIDKCLAHADEKVGIMVLESSRVSDTIDRRLPPIGMPHPYEAFLTEAGYLNDSWVAESYLKDYIRTGAYAWRRACVTEASRAQEEGTIFTPLGARLLSQAIKARDEIREIDKERPDGETYIKHGKVEDMPLGEGLENTLALFEEWVRAAGPEDIAMFKDQDGVGGLGGIIARNTPLVSDVRSMAPIALLLQANLKATLENPHLTLETARALAELGFEVLKTGDDYQAEPFFYEFYRLGHSLSEEQIARLRIIICGGLWPNGYTLAAACSIRDAAQDPDIRRTLLEEATGSLDHRPTVKLMASSQGAQWIELANIFLEDANSGDEQAGDALALGLEITTDWCLEGVNRHDLLGLLGCSNKRVRESSTALVGRLSQVEKTRATETRKPIRI